MSYPMILLLRWVVKEYRYESWSELSFTSKKIKLYQPRRLRNVEKLSHLERTTRLFDVFFCFLLQHFQHAVQLRSLVLSFCVKCRRRQVGVSRVLLNPIHQAWALGLGVYLQRNVETLRLWVKVACIDADLVICVLRW